MDNTSLLQTGIIDFGLFRIGYYTAVASFGNSQAMDGRAGGRRERRIDVLGGGIGVDLNFLREFLDRFT